MYEYSWLILFLILCFFGFVYSLVDTNVPMFFGSIALAIVALMFATVIFNVPSGMIAGVSGTNETIYPGYHLKFPDTTVVYSKTNDIPFETRIVKHAKDTHPVEFWISFDYDIVDPSVFGEYINVYGPDYMNKTYGAYIADDLEVRAPQLDSREWFNHNCMHDIVPILEWKVGEAMKKNGLKLGETGIDINIYMDKDLFNKYGTENMQSRLPGLIERADSMQHNYPTF